MDALTGFIIGLVFACAGAAFFWLYRKKAKQAGSRYEIHSSIEEIRSVGELVVLKVLNKEIVIATDHLLGELGSKYLKWLLTENKLAMIFEFSINFKYDLHNPAFHIRDEGGRSYTFKMPPCFYDTNILNMKFYDEKAGELLPWLLPGMVTKIFGATFSEKEKNFLIEEAKQQAMNTGCTLARQMVQDIESAARRTLTMLAHGLGAREVRFDFGGSELVQTRLDFSAEPLAQQPQLH